MAQPSKRKVEFMLHQDELPDYLKQLGEEMSSGSVSVGDAKLDVSNFTKLGLSIKRVDNGVLVKIKIKYDDDDEFESNYDVDGEYCQSAIDSQNLDSLMAGMEQNKPIKYKPLKKIMKKQFKAIRCALLSGSLPAPELSRGFVQASEWLCSFPDKGESYYAPYMEAVRAFAAAVEVQDIEATRGHVDTINALTKACHDRYK